MQPRAFCVWSRLAAKSDRALPRAALTAKSRYLLRERDGARPARAFSAKAPGPESNAQKGAEYLQKHFQINNA